MRYFPLTTSDREEIKKSLDIQSVEELFSDIPKKDSFYSLDHIPAALDERELKETFKTFADRNRFGDHLSFLGAGAYNHFIPEVVNYISAKGEFLTPYTPYQPEVSQGSLQTLFEYQTMISMLTGLDISNSSLYDGGTAAAEGVLLALRKSRKKRVAVAKNLHPEYNEIIQTYIQNLGIESIQVDFDPATGKVDTDQLRDRLEESCGGFIFQSPNFFGVIEDGTEIADITHQAGGHAIQVVAEAMSLGLLTPPGEHGVDIAVGEAQSFGLPLGFGGPYLGFIAARKEFLRQLPGRIVGETTDRHGRRGYVLTLSTREQHIKRERATSNICTNQAWCAMRAAVYLTTMGKKGLQDISRINHLRTKRFVTAAAEIPGIRIKFTKDYFNEVVLEIEDPPLDDFLARMEERKIIPGVPLRWFYPQFENALLVNFTEIHREEDIQRLLSAIEEST
jgi:glycine dehydrogenase subunit 1